ncbi:MAG: DEAD/DEAH box helicase [Crocinitomicaceae bacterium]|jgi:superfamily II DNA/RNA helicase|nr:DEAD/DEAH box helicase [Crocinitomicaceae bacterium]
MKGFQKLPEQLIENLAKEEIVGFLAEQEKLFSKIREGRNWLIDQGQETGISSLLGWTLIHKVPTPEEGSPRAIIVCKDDAKADEMFNNLKRWAKRMDLTFDLIHERGNKLKQRNDLFDGTEIVVATPKRLYDLYIQNGINLNLIRVFIIEDAEIVFKGNNPGYLLRIADSLPKCQILIAGHGITQKMENYVEEIPFGFGTVRL